MDAQGFSDMVGTTQSIILLVFMGLFAVIVAYALWPRNREEFDRAAHIPLDDDTPQNDPQSDDESPSSGPSRKSEN